MHEPAEDELTSFVRRDPVSAVMFVVAICLTVFAFAATAVFVRTRDPELLKTALVAMGAFAIAGIVFGLVRSVRNRRA